MVPEGRARVVEYLGRFSRIMEPGLNCRVPFLESYVSTKWVVGKDGSPIDVTLYDMRECVFDPPPVIVLSLDRCEIRVDVICTYRIENLREAVYSKSDPVAYVRYVINSTIRDVAASHKMDVLMEKPTLLSGSIMQAFQERQNNPTGVKITDVRVESIKPPKDLVTTSTGLLKARRDAEVRSEIAEAKRLEDLKLSQAQTELQQAEINRERDMVQHESWKAEQRVTAEAKRVKLLCDAGLTSDFFQAELHTQAWKHLVSNNRAIVVPYEAARFLGGAQTMLQLPAPASREDGGGGGS